MGPVRLLYVTRFIVSKCSNKGFYCTRACGTQWGSGPHSALAKLQFLTMFLLVHGWVSGVCMKGELNALEIDGVQSRLKMRALCTSLCKPSRAEHLWPLLAHGKEPNCPQPSGLLYQAVKMDCQKLKEAFISSLTHQSGNWCHLQIQGTLRAHWKLLVTLPGHGLCFLPCWTPNPF